jgi:hypothetical protein
MLHKEVDEPMRVKITIIMLEYSVLGNNIAWTGGEVNAGGR